VNIESHNKPQWFLIYTKPHQEERAKLNLQNQGNEVFLPMIASTDKKKSKSFSIKPMFPRYLFAKFSLGNNNWTNIKSTRGVSHIVVFGENIPKVPRSLLEYLKSKVDVNDILEVNTSIKSFRKGEKVQIKYGPFKGRDAIFHSISSKDRVRVLLSIMSQDLISDLPEHNIERKTVLETFKL